MNQPTKANNTFRLTALFKAFFQSQQSAGILLVVATLLSLVLANSPIAEPYTSFWKTEIGSHLGGFHLKHKIGRAHV